MSHPTPAPASPPAPVGSSPTTESFDTGSHESFYDYYKKQSLSPAALQRFAAIAEVVLRVRGTPPPGTRLAVLDVGCGAGTQCQFWVDRGHDYMGIDINAPLVRLARERAQESGRQAARFEVSSATQLPFADASFDVCLMPELLEHIADWETCLKEAVRVLRPGGVVYVSTSNRLCPKQQEFNLPAYSWYPGFVKRYFERRAVTDWPALANYAKYPAVNWFSYYQLRRWFSAHGLHTADRFDVMRLDNKPAWAGVLVRTLRALPPLRLLGHMATPDTVVVARRT
jgi:ubiquinone/menaquinone biosynthesis C-methylase UbiE